MKALKLVSKSKSFGGFQYVYSYASDVLKSNTKFSIYLPPSPNEKIPLLYYLSGLTCTEQNFILKSGFQRYASEHGFAVVGPDTSPRDCKIEGETDDWDIGEGAGFYVDATTPKWKDHYHMHSFVTLELPSVIKANFPVDNSRQSIMGHSMGGHGALICYLKTPGLYRSCSVLAPLCNPTQSGWGKKALSQYLGDDVKKWEDNDASLLVGKYKGPKVEILVDQGADDEFLALGELMPEKLVEACAKVQFPLLYRKHPAYDHSYNFVSTFIGDHFKHHAKYL